MGKGRGEGVEGGREGGVTLSSSFLLGEGFILLSQLWKINSPKHGRIVCLYCFVPGNEHLATAHCVLFEHKAGKTYRWSSGVGCNNPAALFDLTNKTTRPFPFRKGI